MEEPIRPHEPCVLTTFCLDTHKQSDTSGEFGAQNPKEGQMVPRTEDRTHINMRKEQDRRGEQVPSLLFFVFFVCLYRD